MAKHAKQRRPEMLVAAENELQQEQNWRTDPHHYTDGRRIKTPVFGKHRPHEARGGVDNESSASSYECPISELTSKEKKKRVKKRVKKLEQQLDKAKYDQRYRSGLLVKAETDPKAAEVLERRRE